MRNRQHRPHGSARGRQHHARPNTYSFGQGISEDKGRVTIARALQEWDSRFRPQKGTARGLFNLGILTDVVLKTQEGPLNIGDYIRARKVDLIINTPMGFHARRSDDAILMAPRL